MAKKFCCILMVILFSLTAAVTINTPLQAANQNKKKEEKQRRKKEKEEKRKREEEEKQKKQEEELKYLESLTLEELLKVPITTAAKQEETISDVPASVVWVTREEIEFYGYQSLTEILQDIPGLYLTDDYTTENFGVRGFWTIDPQRNICILVNDVPMVNHFISANALEMINIPVEAIDKIEVVRGPMSVMYGSGAFFGAINIKTNIVLDYFPISILSASAGSEKTYKTVARASGRLEDFQYSFNGSYFNTYGIDVPYSKMANDPAILPGLGLSPDQTTGGQLENREKYFNFSGSDGKFSFNAQFSESQKEIAAPLPAVTDGSLGAFRSLRLSFGYVKKFSDKVRVEAKLGYFFDKWTFDNDYFVKGIYSNQTNAASGYNADLLLFMDPSPKLNITMGINYIKVLEDFVTADIPLFGLPNYTMTLADGESMVTHSIYAQASYSLSEKLKLVAGLRLEQMPEYTIEDTQNEGLDGWLPPGSTTPLKEITNYATYSHTKVEVIPRVALIYSPDERNYYKLLYGKAINRPSFFQSRDLIYVTDIPSLVPETIQTFELNYLATLSRKVFVDLSLFHNRLDKLIYRTHFYDPSLSQYVTYQANVGKMVTNGIEFKFKYRKSMRLTGEISLTYQQTKDRRPGFEHIEPGYSPRFLGYIKGYILFNLDTSLGITGNYVGPMESYYDETLTPPKRLGDKVGGYFLLGANLRFMDIFDTKFFINMNVSNLLDQEIRYPTTSNNSGFAQKGTIGRGRTFLLTLGYYF
jgi:outer membrane receptor protein involved in Fe transport